MQAAGDSSGGGSGMAAVIGADDAALAEVCADCGVDLANFNAPGQTVISGARGAVERAGALIKERGARRVMPLAVSIASHSRLMRPAAAHMAALLAGGRPAPAVGPARRQRHRPAHERSGRDPPPAGRATVLPGALGRSRSSTWPPPA